MARSETGNLLDFNARTEIWGAGFEAFLERPLFGWGYGERFFHMEEPFEGTSYEAPEKGQHNQYLTVLFHQGIVGFIPYLAIIVMTILTFWKEALKSEGIKSYVLIACVSVFFGNYVLHSIFESIFRLSHIAFVLGLGLAAKGIREHSHS